MIHISLRDLGFFTRSVWDLLSPEYSNALCDLQAAPDSPLRPLPLHSSDKGIDVRDSDQSDFFERKSKAMINERPVIVLQLPEKLVVGRVHSFSKQIEALLKTHHPRVVFDLSLVSEMDGAGVKMLLDSMEEVMKRNGDLKLAAISPAPAAILESTGVDHLFEIFDLTSDAVESFDRFPAHVFHAAQPWSHNPARESGSTV